MALKRGFIPSRVATLFALPPTFPIQISPEEENEEDSLFFLSEVKIGMRLHHVSLRVAMAKCLVTSYDMLWSMDWSECWRLDWSGALSLSGSSSWSTKVQCNSKIQPKTSAFLKAKSYLLLSLLNVVFVVEIVCI